jgi:hypothetical protein
MACTRPCTVPTAAASERLSEKEFEMAKSNKKGGTSGSSQTGKSKRKGK